MPSFSSIIIICCYRVKEKTDILKYLLFLKEIRGNEGENFVTPISDPFGPAITDETLQCIVGKY